MSVCLQPCTQHNLIEKIMAKLPEYNLTIINKAISGSVIKKILDRLDNDLTSVNPDAVLLLWDSDVSDIDESVMSSEQITQTRNQFNDDLNSVITKVKQVNSFFASKLRQNMHYPSLHCYIMMQLS